MLETIFQPRSKLFTAGILLTIFSSAIIGFFNIAILFWFGIPIFVLLAGLFLIWCSPERIKVKIFFTFIPLPIIVFSFFLFYLLLPKAEPETFLVPQNFRGQFEIIFNESCGQSVTYDEGRRVYTIPDDGILITNAERGFGVIDRKFYLVEETGQRIELPQFHWSEFEREKDDWHWAFSKSELTKDLVGVFWAYTNGVSYIISNYNNLEKQDRETKEKTRNNFSQKVNLALQKCRSFSY